MESNVEVAVRVSPIFYNDEVELCITPNTYNNTIHLCNSINSHTFPVNYVLPSDCNQDTLFITTTTPLLNYLFEGCDISVVTYGQSGSGKTYTLLGPGLSCALSEAEYGIIPRFLRELFSVICQKKDRNCLVHITWSQICGENVQDLLSVGSVQCINVSQAFDVLHLGMANMTSQNVHTLFTITLEQHWVVDTMVQHKISTASFVDLASSKMMLIMNGNGITETAPTDLGLLSLQKCICALSESGTPSYNSSALTMLLKDSFGGRAKTLVICCVSPLFNNFMETFYTLEFAMRAQMVKNFVTVNSYATYENSDNTDVFGLQFAANQLLQLVANAENLFNNLILNGSLSKSQMQQISKWLTLKQECDDCISDSSEHHRSLDIIKEEEGSQESTSEESEVAYDDETQNDVQQLDDLIQNFKLKTDALVIASNKKYISNPVVKTKSTNSSYNEYHSKGARGRRPSIHSAEKVSLELPKSEEKQNKTKISELSYESKLKILKQMAGEIDSCEKEIKELELTIETKEKFVQQLLAYKNQNMSTRDKLKKNCQKLKAEEDKARTKLLRAKSDKDEDMERKYYNLIKDITKEDVKKISDLESSLRSSKKKLEKLKKHKEEEERQRQSFEYELEKCKRSVGSETSCKNNELIRFTGKTGRSSSEDSEVLKHEIKELRKTRDLLLQHRYNMGIKSHKGRLLKDSDELKIYQIEEAIEIVDLAIEYKNQLLCGVVAILDETTVDKQEENVDKVLIGQLLKLNTNEVRMLLKRYFEKVIDLRSSTKKLEHQLTDNELQNENLLLRIQNLSHALQRVRSESERRIVSLKQQHEDKLQLMIRRFIPDDDEDGEHVMSRVVKTSKQASLAFQVAQTSGKQLDKGSLIAKVTRYARQEIVPRQLQATVTREKNKLIIQQSNK